MTTHTVDIEGLPEGWEVNTIKIDAKQFPGPPFNTVSATVHLRKTKPSRIVLEETGEESDAFRDQEITLNTMKLKVIGANKIWRIKEE